MDKFIILTRRNLRGNKGQYFSFALVAVVAAMILSIGLISLFNFGELYDMYYEENNSFDFFYTVSSEDWTGEMKVLAEETDGVVSTELRESVFLQGKGEFTGGGINLNHVFFNMDNKHEQNLLRPVGATLPLEETPHPVYISYWVAASGAELGDTYRFVGKSHTYEFTIAGFVNDLMYGSNNCGNLGVYLPEEEFDRVYEEASAQERTVTLSCKLEDRGRSKEVFTEFSSRIAGRITTSNDNVYGSYEVSRRNRTLTITVVAAMLVAFSLLLVVITMLVIRFRVKNGIVEEMQNMGVMKSMGFTSGQIMLAVAAPYLLLSVAAVLCGIGLSYLVFPLVVEVFEILSGLYWQQGFDLRSALLVVLVILPVILGGTLFSAARIRRLHPIEALRSGVRQHNFKRNYVPLDRGRLGVHAGLTGKNAVNQIAQNLFLTVILILMTFTGIFSGSGTYNTIMAPNHFLDAMSEENPDLILQATGPEQARRLKESLEEHSEVRKALYYEEALLTVEKVAVKTAVTGDFSRLDNDLCYEGRYPLYDNEIALGTQTAEDTGLRIGDETTITLDGRKQTFLVTGLVQALNHAGELCVMRTEGMEGLKPDYLPSQMYVYLQPDQDAAEFLETVKEESAGLLAGYSNYREMLDKIFGNFMPMTGMMIGGISAVAFLIIIAVLYMITRTIMLQKRQEFGILKAAGFSTSELAWQQACSMLPFIGLGTVAGGLLGKSLINKVWLACLSFTGAKKVDLGIPASWAVCIVLLLTLFTFFTAAVMARKVKKVSVMELIRE